MLKHRLAALGAIIALVASTNVAAQEQQQDQPEEQGGGSQIYCYTNREGTYNVCVIIKENGDRIVIQGPITWT